MTTLVSTSSRLMLHGRLLKGGLRFYVTFAEELPWCLQTQRLWNRIFRFWDVKRISICCLLRIYRLKASYIANNTKSWEDQYFEMGLRLFFWLSWWEFAALKNLNLIFPKLPELSLEMSQNQAKFGIFGFTQNCRGLRRSILNIHCT